MSTKALNWYPSARHRACVALVAEEFDVTVEQLLGGRRLQSIAHARHAAYWLVRRRFRLSLSQVARVLAREDHSTALHGIRAAEMLRERFPDYCEATDRLLRMPLDSEVLPPEVETDVQRQWVRGVTSGPAGKARAGLQATEYQELLPPPPVIVPPEPDMRWCDQCDRRVSRSEAAQCVSRFCSVALEHAA